MDMLAYLTELIKTRKEVGIPGLGTIYKKKSPGRYDAETHSFLPPSYVLDFSSEVREQALLIAHICKKRNISADAASYYVDQFSDEIKRQLQEHSEASFYPLGTLYGSMETLSFKPVNDQNFGFDFYGLPPVKEEAGLAAEQEMPASSTEPVTEDPQPESESFTGEETRVHQVTEEQLELENSNADVSEEETTSLDPAEEQELSDRIDEPANEEIPGIEEISAQQEEVPAVEEIPEQQEEAQPEEAATEEPEPDTEEKELTNDDTAHDENIHHEAAEALPETEAPAEQSTVAEVSGIEDQTQSQALVEQQPAEQLPRAEVPANTEENQVKAVADEQPVYEEIAEVELPKKPVAQPVIETVVPTSINDIYAQANRAVFEPRPTPVLEQPPIEREKTTETGFYNSDGEHTDKANTPIYLKILIALLLVLIGLAAAYFIRPDLFDPILKNGQSAVTPPAQTSTMQDAKLTADSLAKADSLKRSSAQTLPAADTAKKDSSAATKPVAAKPVVPKPETAAPVTPKTIATTPPAAATVTTYEVIGSSVTSQREADRFIANMKSLGITAKAIPPTNGRKIIKLSVGSFKDYNTAHAERPKLEKKLGIKDTYIHTNKPL